MYLLRHCRAYIGGAKPHTHDKIKCGCLVRLSIAPWTRAIRSSDVTRVPYSSYYPTETSREVLHLVTMLSTELDPLYQSIDLDMLC